MPPRSGCSSCGFPVVILVNQLSTGVDHTRSFPCRRVKDGFRNKRPFVAHPDNCSCHISEFGKLLGPWRWPLIRFAHTWRIDQASGAGGWMSAGPSGLPAPAATGLRSFNLTRTMASSGLADLRMAAVIQMHSGSSANQRSTCQLYSWPLERDWHHARPAPAPNPPNRLMYGFAMP
jgi:hypothetical protein